ncbi:MAG TPA: AAA family ATPase, partial [Vicinamibacterales bacterium]
MLGDGDRYVLDVPDASIQLELDRPRRERGDLLGELTVRTTLKGARTSVDDVLSRGSFNASSPTVRQARARLCADLARTNGHVDWHRLIEEFATRVLVAESVGQPAVSLRDVPDTGQDDHYDLEGVIVTRRSPSMIFGDAGTGKSQWLLWQLGQLANRGVRVALADWELDALAHKRRLQAMFGTAMPYVLHIACTRPLVYEADRLRRIIVDERIDYLGVDSVAPACHDEPSNAEAATAFFRALRQLAVGSLLVAHTPKAAELGQERPFGSQFWYALCRSIWFVAAKPSDAESN